MKKIFTLSVIVFFATIVKAQDEKAFGDLSISVSYFDAPMVKEKGIIPFAVLGKFLFLDDEGKFRANICPGVKFRRMDIGVTAGFQNQTDDAMNVGVWFNCESKDEQWELFCIYTQPKDHEWIKADGWFMLPIVSELKFGAGFVVETPRLGPGVKLKWKRTAITFNFTTSYREANKHSFLLGFELTPKPG